LNVSNPSALFAAAAWPVIAGEGEGRLSLKDVLDAGGTIGYLIIALSIVMVALIVQLLLLLRRGAMMPGGLAEEVHQHLAQGKVGDADDACRQHPSVLARMLSSGLAEVRIGYEAVEKAMEDAAMEQSARLLRRVEYLTTIGTVAPMLGLLGTVWGMILAFLEFEQKANPQVSELAPGIYRALVTTLFGLMVAVPAVSAYALFRNRVDERIAEAALLAEHVFADFKLLTARRKREAVDGARRASMAASPVMPHPPSAPIPSVAIQRERRT
jgi:biopolymer transport protein ExbB